MLNVAICGPIGAGKSTLADGLGRDHGYRRISFATALKEEVARACALTDEERDQFLIEMNDVHTKSYWRTILQWWGTELRRNRYGEDYWVNQTAAQVKRALDEGVPVVVDDCRFPNEERMFRELGFTFVLAEPSNREPAPGDEHSSEAHWRDWRYDLTIPRRQFVSTRAAYLWVELCKLDREVQV